MLSRPLLLTVRILLLRYLVFHTLISSCYALQAIDDSDLENSLYSKGEIHLQNKEYKEAVAELSKTIKKQPHEGFHYIYRGEAYYSSGQFEKAIDDFTTGASKLYNPVSAYFLRGLCYENINNDKKAIADFKRTYRQLPGYYFHINGRDFTWKKKKRYDDRIARLEKAGDLKPGNAITYIERGILLTLHHKYNEALTDFNSAAELIPDDFYVFYSKARAYCYLRQFGMAMTNIDKAISLYSSDKSIIYDQKDQIFNSFDKIGLYNQKGHIFAETGKYEDAAAEYNKVLATAPDSFPHALG